MNGLLLTYLNEHANSRGLVIIREKALRDRLNVDREALAAELRALEAEGAIRILSPLPFLTLKLKKWSSRVAKPANSPGSAYSYSKLLQPKRLIDSYRHEASAAEQTPENLTAEILNVLGETDASSFVKAVELYSPHVIRAALDRVRQARGIRKSKTALFRHLLPRLAQQSRSV